MFEFVFYNNCQLETNTRIFIMITVMILIRLIREISDICELDNALDLCYFCYWSNGIILIFGVF